MADRDRYEWERDREYPDRDRDYGRARDRERGYQDRRMMSRGSSDREFGPNSERVRREHGDESARRRDDRQYSGGYGGDRSRQSSGSFAGRGPRNYQRSDDRIREDVNECLTADPRIDASDVDVDVQNGQVTLTGAVNDGRTRRWAEEIIEDMPGVREVHNDLRVNRGHWSSSGDQSRHREIGEQSRGREDGAVGHTGNPQTRDDVTTINTKEGRE